MIADQATTVERESNSKVGDVNSVARRNKRRRRLTRGIICFQCSTDGHLAVNQVQGTCNMVGGKCLGDQRPDVLQVLFPVLWEENYEAGPVKSLVHL